MNTDSLLTWRKSTRCETSACVEVAVVDDAVLLRDGKDPGGPVLRFSNTSWTAFVEAAREGNFG